MATLTIITEDNEITYTNYTGSGPLSFEFPHAEKLDINVDVDGVTLAQSEWVHSPVVVDGGFDGGTVTLVTPVAGADVRIWRDMVRLRTSQFGAGGANPRQVDTEFNRLVLMAQDARKWGGGGGGSGISDAPVDGQYYARKDASWETFTPGSGGGGGGANTVTNYAALTAITAANRTDDMLVYVGCRTTDGDGGEGWWRFDSAATDAANAGTILQPDAGTGRWFRLIDSDEYRLTWWGTNYTAFNSALDVAIAAGKWLNCDYRDVTMSALKTTALTSPLKLRRVNLKKLTKTSVNEEVNWQITGPDYPNVTTLSANATIGATSISVSSATNIVADGLYLLISNTNWNPDPAAYGNSVAVKSTYIRVAPTYTSGTTVPLSAPLQRSFLTSASARLYRVSEAAEIWFDEVSVEGGGATEAQCGIRFDKCVIKMFNPTGGRSLNNDFIAFDFNLCSFDDYVYIRAFGSRRAGLGYGASFSGCNNPLIAYAKGLYTRHLVTFGSSYTTTLPFSGGNAVILGEGGILGPVSDPCAYGSIMDVHTGHVGLEYASVSGNIIGGVTQEAVTIESHSVRGGPINVTGADLGVSIYYYGHPADEEAPSVSIGAVNVGRGGTSTNRAVICLNRDASTRRPFHVQIDSINGNWPALLYAGAEQGQINVSVGKVTGTTRTHHSVEAVCSANGQAFIHIEHPDFIEDSGNAAIYAVRADGDAYNNANPGQLGAIVSLGQGNITADNTAYYALDAQIVLNGTRGTSTKVLSGLGTVLIPGEIRSTTRASGSPLSLTTDSTANLAQMDLEPGLWRVTGAIGFNPSGTTSITRMIAAINTSSATIPLPDAVAGAVAGISYAAYVPAATGQNILPGEAILDLRTTSGNTTVYLIARATFTASTLTAYGHVKAQRIA